MPFILQIAGKWQSPLERQMKYWKNNKTKIKSVHRKYEQVDEDAISQIIEKESNSYSEISQNKEDIESSVHNLFIPIWNHYEYQVDYK